MCDKNLFIISFIISFPPNMNKLLKLYMSKNHHIKRVLDSLCHFPPTTSQFLVVERWSLKAVIHLFQASEARLNLFGKHYPLGDHDVPSRIAKDVLKDYSDITPLLEVVRCAVLLTLITLFPQLNFACLPTSHRPKNYIPSFFRHLAKKTGFSQFVWITQKFGNMKFCANQPF